MAFSFSFGSDDIAFDGEQDADQSLSHALQNTSLDQTESLIKPKQHNLQEFLEDIPSQLSYNILKVPTQPACDEIAIPRRALFDINTQLLYEADPSTDRQTLIDGLANGDLQSGFYEGGFKTWECSTDLAGFLAQRTVSEDECQIVELGAGSAIPSIVLLSKLAEERRNSDQEHKKIKFTLCDYNEDVLRLCTAANVLLAVLYVMKGGRFPDMPEDGNGELDIDYNTIKDAMEFLHGTNIEISFISGAWSSEFFDLLHLKSTKSLILASETIYSPESTDEFTNILFRCLKISEDCEVLVAAKKMYFGVGGGVAEFGHAVNKAGGRTCVVLDVPNAGVGRVILRVQKTDGESASDKS